MFFQLNLVLTSFVWHAVFYALFQKINKDWKMWVVRFHLVLKANLNLLIFHFSSCYMVYYYHIFNVYHCFVLFFFLFQMPWLWRIHAGPYLYPYSSSQRNTETHCEGCYKCLVARSHCMVYEFYVVCFVKESFTGCEEEGCMLLFSS